MVVLEMNALHTHRHYKRVEKMNTVCSWNVIKFIKNEFKTILHNSLGGYYEVGKLFIIAVATKQKQP